MLHSEIKSRYTALYPNWTWTVAGSAVIGRTSVDGEAFTVCVGQSRDGYFGVLQGYGRCVIAQSEVYLSLVDILLMLLSDDLQAASATVRNLRFV